MSRVKLANSPSAEFEQAFFQLAFERLQDKLYNLLDYLVGFDIVNKSSDGTKAIGVFGFKAENGQMIFVPAFFKDGDVKGVDIMYSKNNEQFYPLNEDFAEMFLKDDASGLGTPTDETVQQMKQYTPPTDMMNLVRPPRTAKVSYASVIDYVEQSDNLTKEAFQTIIEKDPEYLESLMRFYDVEKIAKALVKKKDADKVLPVPSVKVVTQKDDLKELSDSQKSKVLSDGYVVIDKRKAEQKSEFGLHKFEEKFVNPGDSGFYPYVTKSGSIRYALIIPRPMSITQRFASDEAMVINLDEGYSYQSPVSCIFTKGQIVVKDTEDLLSGFQDPAEARPSFSDTFILINDSLKATEPFRILTNFKDDGGLRRIEVERDGFSDCCVSSSYSGNRKGGNSYFSDKPQGRRPNRITFILTKKPGDSLHYDGDVVYVPKGFKLLPIKTSVSYSETESKRQEEKNKYEQGKPGSRSTILGALTSNRVYPMNVTSNGSEYFVDVASVKKKYDTPIKAKTAMIVNLGLDEQTVDNILSKVANQISQKGYIKLAYTGDQSFAPWDPSSYSNELGQPTYDGVGHSEVQAPGDGYTGDPTKQGLGVMPEVEGTQAAIQQANQLAQGGQKEIFDTHSIATLAKYVSPQTKVTDYMPDFISCLDKLGRMLFLVYWETDKFEEMYGRSELPEMTELLSNVFRNLGDLIIFLKRKSPELSINMAEAETTA